MTELRRAKARSFDDVPNTRGGAGLKYASEVFDLLDLSKHDGKFVPIRFIGGLVAYTMHWVSIQKRDGEWTNIPKICLSYDPDTMDYDPQRRCPYCEAAAKFRSMEVTVKVKGRKNNPVSTNTDYLYNAINRELQEEITPKIATQEEADSGFKVKDSKSRTPVQVVRLTKSLANKLKDLKNLNVHLVPVKGKGGETKKSRVAQDLSHPKYGIDVFLKYDSKADAANAYSVQKDAVTPLTDEEVEFLRWDIESFPYLNEPESEEEADANIAGFGGACWELVTGKKKRKVEDVDYEDDDEDIEDDYADEDDEPVRKPASKSKRKVVDEDDEEELPTRKKSKRPPVDEDEDEDDEPPVRKSKRKVVDEDEDDEPVRKPSKSKRPPVDEDDDDDDEPVRKPKSKRKVDEDDEVDLDEMDDLDEDEDEPAPKAKGKSAKSKRKVVDDEDDEDDEPVRKPSKSKRKIVDEDDDDLPF